MENKELLDKNKKLSLTSKKNTLIPTKKINIYEQ